MPWFIPQVGQGFHVQGAKMTPHLNRQRQPDHRHDGIGDDHGQGQALPQIDLTVVASGQDQGKNGPLYQNLQSDHHFDQGPHRQQAVQANDNQPQNKKAG